MITRKLAAAVAGVVAAIALTLGPTAAAQVPQSIWPPCVSYAKACVQLSTNQAWLMNGGFVTYGPVPVRHGKPGYETPPGIFSVTFKNINHWSTIYDAPMPYSVFFNGGIAFHEGSLDSGSGGCVRLSREAAQTFFYTLNPGDTVQVVW
ncbi:L,D-transpeptidase [Hoyosella sp. YIM 151337]|uniref:L,D-transpeptidase n=1 Tax=Hoyosella sp. YIM 151337 TaxID=2992742 RepID=UPI0022368E95|nr:L,D-transpeptidase [Hoyosella sp. YIM 151337]MCW4351712.1 L,D-transpeptidase [Hoyosella sp. YIM 151337]